jgi:cytochrome c biogenesis protein
VALRAERYRVDLLEGGRARPAAVAAEKGYLRELGNLSFHLALLLLLVAVAVGHRGGYRANVAVPEGVGFANTPAQFDTYTAGAGVDAASLPPFSVKLDRLEVTYQESGSHLGTPRMFDAHVQWRPTPDAPLQESVIRPNSPLEVGGSKVFLLGQGYAPRFTVRDGGGRVVSSGPVVLLPREGDPNLTSTGALKVPDALPEQLGFDLTFLPTTLRVPAAEGGTVPVSVFPDARLPRVFVTGAWRGDLGLDGGAAQSVYRLDTSRMTQVQAEGRPASAELAPGDSLTLPDGLGSITFDGTARFASFSVAGDPGRGEALAAGLLALLGLLTSLYLRPRRLWVQAIRAGGGDGADGHTVVEVAAWSRTTYDGLTRETARLVGHLQQIGPPSAPPGQPPAQSSPPPPRADGSEIP